MVISGWLRRRCVIGACLIVAAALAGCAREYRTHRGKPRGFSTHSFRLQYPAAFLSGELPQMSLDILTVASFVENIPMAPNTREAPGMILVRAHRMRQQENAQTFMERYYDDWFAPRFLDAQMRPRPGAAAPEWMVSGGDGCVEARVVVLERERLAYEVLTSCPPDKRERFAAAFRRARESFVLGPARR